MHKFILDIRLVLLEIWRGAGVWPLPEKTALKKPSHIGVKVIATWEQYSFSYAFGMFSKNGFYYNWEVLLTVPLTLFS